MGHTFVGAALGKAGRAKTQRSFYFSLLRRIWYIIGDRVTSIRRGFDMVIPPDQYICGHCF